MYYVKSCFDNCHGFGKAKSDRTKLKNRNGSFQQLSVKVP